MLRDRGFIELLDEIASKSPAPGGGSGAAVAGAVGCSLLMMVCNLTIGKKKYAEVQEEVEGILEEATRLRNEFLELIDADNDAFLRLFEFFKLKERTPEQEAAMKDAETNAIHVPQRTMKTALRAIEAAARLAPIGNRNAISDVGVAGHFAHTAFHGGKLNVLINLAGKEESEREEYLTWVADMRGRFTKAYDSLVTTVDEGVK